MKNPEGAEIVIGANDEGAESRLVGSGPSRAFHHADTANPHGVDGPDELAAAVGTGSGGICAAGRGSGAADVERTGEKEIEAGGDEAGGGGENDRGGAGKFRLLSGHKM